MVEEGTIFKSSIYLVDKYVSQCQDIKRKIKKQHPNLVSEIDDIINHLKEKKTIHQSIDK